MDGRIDGEETIPNPINQNNGQVSNYIPNGYPHPVDGVEVDQVRQVQCHIFTYESPWKTYAVGYSWRQDKPYRFGISSYIEEKMNKVF